MGSQDYPTSFMNILVVVDAKTGGWVGLGDSPNHTIPFTLSRWGITCTSSKSREVPLSLFKQLLTECNWTTQHA